MHTENGRTREPRNEISSFVELHPLTQDPEALLEQIVSITRDEERNIGEGGAGVVWHLNNYICVKMLREHKDSEFQQARDIGLTDHISIDPVEREAKILASLNTFRPAKTQVRTPICYAYYRMPDNKKFLGKSGIVMEKLNAITLLEALNNPALVPDSFNAFNFLRELETYLEALHDRGIVHGDLNPRNVMIDLESGLPILIDFGNAQVLHPTNKSQWQTFLDKERREFEALDIAIDAIPELT